MNISELGEFGLIERIARKVVTGKGVVRGIGDDAAVLPLTKDRYLLLTTDMMAEGVHFSKQMKASDVGHKALACNISDIAAMGGWPTYAVISLGLPPSTKVKWVDELYQGINACAKAFNVRIVGGDTIKASQIVINIALMGQAAKSHLVTRSGAKAGDWIFVTGPLGGSLKSGRHLTFTPKVAQAQFLVQHFKPSAMMDISDGLAGDLNHILKASKTGARLWQEQIPRQQGCTLAQALGDGEDYELLFTLSKAKAVQLMAWQEQNKSWYFYPVGQITSNPRQTVKIKSFTHF